MGCLHWPADLALDTPLPWIELAMNSYWRNLRLSLGLPPEPPAPETLDRPAVARKTLRMFRALAKTKG